MAAQVDLTQGSVSGHILRMLAPFWVAILALMSAGVVDTIYLGRLSTNALAAVGFCFPIMFIGNSINIGLGAGVISAVSRDIGKKRFNEARAHGASAILLSLALLSAYVIMCYFVLHPVLRLMGITAEILPLSAGYLKIALPSLIFTGIGMICNNTLRAGGEAVLPSTIMISGAILNVIIDPFLIFGLGPFPKMGVEGAALATLISAVFTAGYGLFLANFHRKALSFVGLGKARILEAWRIIGKVGVPAMGSNIIVPISTFVIITIIARTIGTLAVAAATVTGRVEMLAICLLYALSACIGANTGQNGGAGLSARVREAFTVSYILCLIWAIICAIGLALFTDPILGIFTKDTEVVELARSYFYIVPITFAGYGAVFVSAAGLNGLGRPIEGLVYTIIRSIILAIPLVWIGAEMFGLRGVYMAMAITNIIAGGIAYFYTRYRVPMTIVQH